MQCPGLCSYHTCRRFQWRVQLRVIHYKQKKPCAQCTSTKMKWCRSKDSRRHPPLYDGKRPHSPPRDRAAIPRTARGWGPAYRRLRAGGACVMAEATVSPLAPETAEHVALFLPRIVHCLQPCFSLVTACNPASPSFPLNFLPQLESKQPSK